MFGSTGFLKRCPVCDEGKLHPQMELNEVEHRGHKAKLKMKYSLCDECGSEVAGPKEINWNAEQTKRFRARVDEILAEADEQAF